MIQLRDVRLAYRVFPTVCRTCTRDAAEEPWTSSAPGTQRQQASVKQSSTHPKIQMRSYLVR